MGENTGPQKAAALGRDGAAILVATASGLAWSWRASSTAFARTAERNLTFPRPAPQTGTDYRLAFETPAATAIGAGRGGADAFLSLLADPRWPELARRPPLRDDGRGLAGHSLGSLPVVPARLPRKLFFNRLLAGAPSGWWDNRTRLRPRKKGVLARGRVLTHATGSWPCCRRIARAVSASSSSTCRRTVVALAKR